MEAMYKSHIHTQISYLCTEVQTSNIMAMKSHKPRCFTLKISTHQQVAVFTKARTHRSVAEQTTSRTFCGRTHWEVHYASTTIMNTPQTYFTALTAEDAWEAKKQTKLNWIIKPMIITVWCGTIPTHLGKTNKQAKNSFSTRWPTEIHFKWPPAASSEQNWVPSPKDIPQYQVKYCTGSFSAGH